MVTDVRSFAYRRQDREVSGRLSPFRFSDRWGSMRCWTPSTLVILLLISTPGRANDQNCHDRLSKLSGADPREVLEQLRNLPPVALDLPSIREGVRRLIRELRELRGDFEELSQFERSLAEGTIDPTAASSFAQEGLERSSVSAHTLLQKNEVQSHRNLLEGFRILMSRYIRLHNCSERDLLIPFE